MVNKIIIVILVAALLFMVPTEKKEAESVKVAYDGTPVAGSVILHDDYRGQTFFTTDSFSVTKVSVYLNNRWNLASEDISLEIQETSNHIPTGTVVASTVFSRNLITAISPDFSLVTINMGGEVLEAGMEYAIIIKPLADISSNAILMARDTGDGYAGVSLRNNGAWTPFIEDHYFIIHGINHYDDVIDNKNNYLSGLIGLSSLRTGMSSWIAG